MKSDVDKLASEIVADIADRLESEVQITYGQGLELVALVRAHLLHNRASADIVIHPPMNTTPDETKMEPEPDLVEVEFWRSNEFRAKLNSRLANRVSITWGDLRDIMANWFTGRPIDGNEVHQLADALCDAGRLRRGGSVYYVTPTREAVPRFIAAIPIDQRLAKYDRKNGVYRFAEEIGDAMLLHRHTVLSHVQNDAGNLRARF